MTKVDILPEPTESGQPAYRAVAGAKQSVGKTAGEALDALTAQLPEEATGTLVVVQCNRADEFFTAEQRRRLTVLMDRWRAARDRGNALPDGEQVELDALVEAELQASAKRTQAVLAKLSP